jgi:hypothetical protein
VIPYYAHCPIFIDEYRFIEVKELESLNTQVFKKLKKYCSDRKTTED